MLVNSEQSLCLHSFLAIFFFARTQYFKVWNLVNTPSNLISSCGSLVWMSHPKSFSPLSPNFVPGLKNFNSRSFLCAIQSTSWLPPHIYDVLCYNIATNALKKVPLNSYCYCESCKQAPAHHWQRTIISADTFLSKRFLKVDLSFLKLILPVLGAMVIFGAQASLSYEDIHSELSSRKA